MLVRGPRSPAELELGQDGLLKPPAAETATVRAQPEASRYASTDPFVAIAIACVVVAAGVASLGTQAQLPAYLRGAGMLDGFAALLLGLTAAGSLIGSLTIGPVLDRFPGYLSALLVSGAFYAGLLSIGSLLGTPDRLVAIVASMLLGYPAEFFTRFAPQTALDLLAHVLGFALDAGQDVRGCCQSNANPSLHDASRAGRAGAQLAMSCHSARAAERRSL